MLKGTLPEFRYFRDPLGVGVIQESECVCVCCSQKRGYIYVGPVYAEEELDEQICPWCITDGSAAVRFSATFIDELGIGGYGRWESVPEQVIEELHFRTPCFTGWQSENWWTHCGDGAVFLDYAGREELIEYGVDLINRLKDEAGVDDSQWDHVFQAMEKEGSVIAYVFQCLHCGELGGYWDCC